jgi:hypothetical protein
MPAIFESVRKSCSPGYLRSFCKERQWTYVVNLSVCVWIYLRVCVCVCVLFCLQVSKVQRLY